MVPAVCAGSLCVTDETGTEIFRTRLVNMQRASHADAIVRAARNDEN
jgi:hypothetical protein